LRRLRSDKHFLSRRFEIEAEITVKVLERGFRWNEIPVVLRPREAGSYSKIGVVRDGLRIVGRILALFRDNKHLKFFGAWGLLFIMIGLLPGINAVIGYLETGLVLRFPSAILAFGLILTGLIFIAIGLILHTIDRQVLAFGRREGYMRSP
jgi:hypothetical protein